MRGAFSPEAVHVLPAACGAAFDATLPPIASSVADECAVFPELSYAAERDIGSVGATLPSGGPDAATALGDAGMEGPVVAIIPVKGISRVAVAVDEESSRDCEVIDAPGLHSAADSPNGSDEQESNSLESEPRTSCDVDLAKHHTSTPQPQGELQHFQVIDSSHSRAGHDERDIEIDVGLS